MEYGTIEREIHIDASPEVVFDVVSSPEHLREWWPDEAEYPAVPGERVGSASATARRAAPGCSSRSSTPCRRGCFSFRWTHDEGETAAPGNSFLVVFELEPAAGDGTLAADDRERLPRARLGRGEGRRRVRRARQRLGLLPAAAAARTPPRSERERMSVMVDDDLWSAVGDPTRRRMLDLLLSDGSGTATSLSEHLPVTRQAVAKHLVVLDRVGLVHGTAAGREKQFRVDQAQLARAVAQLADVGAAWDSPPPAHQAHRRDDPARHGREPNDRPTEKKQRGTGDDRHPAPHRRRAVLAEAGLRRAHHPRRTVRLVDRGHHRIDRPRRRDRVPVRRPAGST